MKISATDYVYIDRIVRSSEMSGWWEDEDSSYFVFGVAEFDKSDGAIGPSELVVYYDREKPDRLLSCSVDTFFRNRCRK